MYCAAPAPASARLWRSTDSQPSGTAPRPGSGARCGACRGYPGDQRVFFLPREIGELDLQIAGIARVEQGGRH
jgi:hypothetical protein